LENEHMLVHIFLEFKGGTAAFILQRPLVKHLYIIHHIRRHSTPQTIPSNF